MMIEQLRELLNREPFVAFRIVLSSGEGFEVSNPDLVALGQSFMHVLEPRSDKFAILRLNQIASIQSADRAA
jgi:hypothetical protein